MKFCVQLPLTMTIPFICSSLATDRLHNGLVLYFFYPILIFAIIHVYGIGLQVCSFICISFMIFLWRNNKYDFPLIILLPYCLCLQTHLLYIHPVGDYVSIFIRDVTLLKFSLRYTSLKSFSVHVFDKCNSIVGYNCYFC